MFQINNQWWYISFVPKYSKILQRSDGTYTVGVTDNDTKTVYIDETIKGYFLRKVLCHEITHAAMFSYGIKLNIEQEELLADLIATYGTEIISITDKIFARIKGELLSSPFFYAILKLKKPKPVLVLKCGRLWREHYLNSKPSSVTIVSCVYAHPIHIASQISSLASIL